MAIPVSDVREFQKDLEAKVREDNVGKTFKSSPGIAPKYERSLDEYEFSCFAINGDNTVTVRFSHKRSSDVLVILVEDL